ncbi:MAG: SpoIIE family protein phosphatase [Calditrichota bacterium]
MPSKILVVDDEADLELLINMNFRKEIRREIYAFEFAHNGRQALDKLEQHPDIEVVLSDINMPEMDGLSLLAKINELYPLIRTVIISAYGDTANIRTALNRGAFDFITKPVDLEDLGLTLAKTLNAVEERKTAREQEKQLIGLKYELDAATRIQTTILPRDFPPYPDRSEIDLHARMDPAKEVGGDFYDFYWVSETELGFAVGDVSGKGMPAALFMAVSRTFVKATALTGLSPADCMTRVNKSLCKESIIEMFVTLFFGILDIKTGKIRYCSAGHNPPMLINKKGDVYETDNTGGIMLAGMPMATFKEGEMTLETDDMLVLFTDGISEAFNMQEEEYGEIRMMQILKKAISLNCSETIEALFKDVETFAGEAVQSDDRTVLALRYRG